MIVTNGCIVDASEHDQLRRLRSFLVPSSNSKSTRDGAGASGSKRARCGRTVVAKVTTQLDVVRDLWSGSQDELRFIEVDGIYTCLHFSVHLRFRGQG